MSQSANTMACPTTQTDPLTGLLRNLNRRKTQGKSMAIDATPLSPIAALCSSVASRVNRLQIAFAIGAHKIPNPRIPSPIAKPIATGKCKEMIKKLTP